MTDTNLDLARVRDLRIQFIVDGVIGVGLAMLAWPFPLARATLALEVHVLMLLGFTVLVHLAYTTVCAVVWGRTIGMRLMGSEVRAGALTVSRTRLAVWGLVSGFATIVGIIAPAPVVGLSERTSGLRLDWDS